MPTASVVTVSAWTPPPTITGFSGTALEDESAIQLNWDVSTVDSAEFVGYRIYRRESGEELYETLTDIPNKAVVEYRDEVAGQTIEYEYVIVQYKAVVGDVPLESLQSETVTITLVSDAWFIKPLGMEAKELFVTSEDHTSTLQQEIFEPLASDRKRIVRGNVLGDEGSITSQFDTSVSRATKQYFESLNTRAGPHILKSAFGDVWLVEIDAPSFKYLVGGHLEVSFGWVEI